VVFLSLSWKIVCQYLDYAVTASYQILSDSLFTNLPTIVRYIFLVINHKIPVIVLDLEV
jgi:hypothetical protein